MPRPSDPLLGLLRDVIRKKALTTQELAEKTGIDRSILKKRLSGVEAMTVDDLVVLSDALSLGAESVGFDTRNLHLATPTADVEGPDPTGNLSKQVVQQAFALGIDIMLMLDATQLGDSGVPSSVLSRFKDVLPIRLEARFHRHNKPVFGEQELQLVLSFDKLYTCAFPWTAFRQVHFLLPVEEPLPVAPPPAREPEKVTKKAPFLRVVK